MKSLNELTKIVEELNTYISDKIIVNRKSVKRMLEQTGTSKDKAYIKNGVGYIGRFYEKEEDELILRIQSLFISGDLNIDNMFTIPIAYEIVDSNKILRKNKISLSTNGEFIILETLYMEEYFPMPKHIVISLKDSNLFKGTNRSLLFKDNK